MYVLRATEVVKRLLYRGLLNKVYGEALSRGPSPDPFYPDTCTIFDRNGTSFVYVPLKNGTS